MPKPQELPSSVRTWRLGDTVSLGRVSNGAAAECDCLAAASGAGASMASTVSKKLSFGPSKATPILGLSRTFVRRASEYPIWFSSPLLYAASEHLQSGNRS